MDTTGDAGGGGGVSCTLLGTCPPPPPPPPPTLQPTSTTIGAGIHLGPIAQISVPDYDDDSYNGMPWSSGPIDYDDNFYIFFDVEYTDSGISMSDIYTLNQYNGTAKIETIEINNYEVYTGNVYLPSPDGLLHSIPGTGGNYDGNTSIIIDVTVSYIVDIGHGPDLVPVPFDLITLPSLPEFIHFMQTGEVLPSIPIP